MPKDPRRFIALWTALIVLTVVTCAAGLLIGHGDLSNEHLRAALVELRTDRVAVAFLAGSALAVAGVFVQGLFRNPLASPSILGTTAGASLGGQIALMLFELAVGTGAATLIPAEMMVSVGAIAGALFALVLLLTLVGRRRDLIVVLLVGFILSSLFLSAGGFLVSLAQDSWGLGRAIVAFSLGSVAGSGPRHVALAVPLVLIGVIATWLWHRPLDLLLSGEEEAASLGVDVAALRRWCVVWTAILTAAAVAVGGNVSFVGLIVPHAMRPLFGAEHRYLVPAAALAGGAFLVLCDILARLPGREIPLGVITGLIGAPVFLLLLIRAGRKGTYG